MNLTEFHSGYRAYNLHALRKIDFTHMTDDFHFDTEIIIKLHHQHYTIKEVPIPTYYGNEICYVNGMKYARNVARAVYRYKQTCRIGAAAIRSSRNTSSTIRSSRARIPATTMSGSMVGSGHEVLDVGCGEGFFAAELKKDGNRVTGIDVLPEAGRGVGARAVLQRRSRRRNRSGARTAAAANV